MSGSGTMGSKRFDQQGEADKLKIIGPTPKTDAQVRAEANEVMVKYLAHVNTLEAKFEAATKALRQISHGPSNVDCWNIASAALKSIKEGA